MGGKDLDIIRQHYRSGLPPPKRILEAPDLHIWLIEVWNGFWELSTCRTDTSPIPWTAIHQYIHAYDIGNPEWFTELIRGMDREYIGFISKSRQPIGKTEKGQKQIGRK